MKTLKSFICFCSFVFVALVALLTHAKAACIVANSNGSTTTPKADILYTLLSQATPCPSSLQALKTALTNRELPSRAALVANRGRNNPALGSFSFFEVVESQKPSSSGPSATLFFGHFTGAQNGQLILDQTPSKGKLLIELIAWDTQKGYYNFYELIGTGQTGQWFYRGDSQDILKDNAALYLGPEGQPPQFGARLRCSGCHTSGGPIMKELALPHNDWWSFKRPLPFGSNQPSAEISQMMSQAMEARDFAALVADGIGSLEASSSYQSLKKNSSKQQLLRPLFCETEINLESSPTPTQSLQVPSAFVLNPLLNEATLPVDGGIYKNLLKLFDMKFPETSYADADHPWLTPVKGFSDLQAIQSLIQQKIIDNEFALDVLSIDMQNPLFSKQRCDLLKLVPDGPMWKDGFLEILNQSSWPSAQELAQNLENPTRNSAWHKAQAHKVILKAQTALQNAKGTQEYFKKLLYLRQSVFDSEISQNPRGQILEPGFRVIFPEAQAAFR